MSNDIVKSKVVVYEHDPIMFEVLGNFLEQNNLVGLKASSTRFNKIFLDEKIDLGAVFIAADENNDTARCIELIVSVNENRPELPIIVRAEEGFRAKLNCVEDKVAGFYTATDFTPIHDIISAFLFNRYYPSQLVAGIQDITSQALASNLKNIEVKASYPYLVHDRIIFGEVYSLIPLESEWCRGYMMLQTSEEDVLSLIQDKRTFLNADNANFRDVNDLLSEITNLAWGGIKSRFFNVSSQEQVFDSTVQVPILVNHNHRFISFGSNEPQLCFHYEIVDVEGQKANVSVFQKIAFNLNWNPEKMEVSEQKINEIVDSGELEFF